MWKATLFSLAALLSIVHGYHPSNPRLGVASWDRMLSKIMVSGTNKGTCGDHCFVTLNGETKVFPIDVSVVFTSKPCTSFICTKDVVQEIQITCPKVDCNGAIPYRDPNSCCNRCPGGPDIEVEFEEWMEWTECSTTCGAGSRARRRTCKITDQDTVAECSGRLLETESCTLGPCPVDCEWKYGEFETCSRSCGAGQMSRFPIITQHPMNGGEPCPPFVVSGQPDVQPCNLRECPVDCDWEYEQFGQCSVSCGNGIKRQFPVITIQPKHGGAPCPDSVIDRVPNIEPCDAGPCPEDCEWEYEEFGDCSVTCGGGIKHQFPLIIRQATNGGVDCPAFVHRGDPNTMNCNTQPCPVDCEWEYEQFGECSKSCGEGIKTRYPRITVQPQHGGQDCPLFVQNQEPDTTTCNNSPCPVHCEWKYGEYGECSKTCGGGTKTRFPVIITQPQHGGRACPAHVIDGEPDSTSCNPLECPIVCGPGQTGCPNEAGELVCIDDKDGDCIPDTQVIILHNFNNTLGSCTNINIWGQGKITK
ncbi:Hemicentin-1 [Geodia barretti]|uniref:Hemicentin-1 n=1 Tax=Geodia barretti TaxID=519541 RepID=A0AA35W3N5_GEOBA|nr:Hemicentin-1 [Geodia barretti]